MKITIKIKEDLKPCQVNACLDETVRAIKSDLERPMDDQTLVEGGAVLVGNPEYTAAQYWIER